MLWLSELIMQNREIEHFSELQKLVRQKAAEGELQMNMDVKPPYPDTPQNWENSLEAAFSMIPGFGD